MVVKTAPMAKRAGEKTATIRVTERVARWIEIICTAEDASSSEVASPILEKALAKRYQDAVDSLNRERAEFKKESP